MFNLKHGVTGKLVDTENKMIRNRMAFFYVVDL